MYVSSTEVQNNFGRYLKACEHTTVVITRNGKNRAILIPWPRSIRGHEAHEPVHEYGTSPRKDRRKDRWGENHVTYRDFRSLVDTSENRYELIDGVLYMLASPSFDHQAILGNLYAVFRDFFTAHDQCIAVMAPFDVELVRESVRQERNGDESDINVVQPDLVVICDYRKDLDENGRYHGTPSLVVEILSPSSRGKDRIKKLDLYADCGVGECWIVDPQNRVVIVHEFRDADIVADAYFGSGDRAKSATFPGLSVDVDALLSD